MANSISHASLPYPIKNARFSVLVPYLDADGDPTDPTTPDTELSQDAGAFADATEEVSTITGSNGIGYVTLTGAETNNSAVALAAKVASGPKATLMTLYPRNLAVVGSGTLSAGSAGGGTLGTLLSYDVTGCFIRTTGGTGGGGTGGANNQARRIITYNTSTGAFTVSPNWETTPDNTTTYDVLLPEGVTLGMLKTLNPATAGRTLVVDSAGLADANMVKVGPSGSGVATTAALCTNLKLAYDTDFATVYDTTNKAFLSKLGNFAMGGSSLALSLGSLSNAGTTTLTGAVTATNASNDLRGILLQATQTGVTIPTVTTVGSVSGAVGSVTGNVGGNVVGSVGSISGVSFPSNFAALGINASGHVSRVTLVDTTTTNTDMITAAGIRTAVGLASANLDTQLTAIDDYLATEVAAIKAKTDNLPASPAASTDAATALTTALTEGYRGTGATGSVRDLLYEIIAHMGESSIVSTTKTLKKIDGSTTAKTYTLNDATNPTGITETT